MYIALIFTIALIVVAIAVAFYKSGRSGRQENGGKPDEKIEGALKQSFAQMMGTTPENIRIISIKKVD